LTAKASPSSDVTTMPMEPSPYVVIVEAMF